MSGVLSGGTALIGGQYGSVSRAPPGFRSSSLKPDLSRRQIYSLTRVATLLAAILNLIGLDATIPINCQVGAKSSSRLYVFLPTFYNSKAWVTFNFVSTPCGLVALVNASF